jgi:hypothetical protein
MPNFNPRLETAIARTADQPEAGNLPVLTPEQQTQLRAVIASDARLLAQFNASASSGNLRGFTLSTPNGTSNLLGIYDGQIVQLPASSLDAGNAARLSATLRVQAMSLEFTRAPGVTPEMVENLQRSLNSSPALAAQVQRAVTPPAPGQHAPLEHFTPLTGTHAGGMYDGSTRSMQLPLTSLTQLGQDARFSERDLTFMLAHETQHGFNDKNSQAAANRFWQQASRIAQSPTLPHDYTEPIRYALDMARRDEASAQIAGWNALLSRERQLNLIWSEYQGANTCLAYCNPFFTRLLRWRWQPCAHRARSLLIRPFRSRTP